MIKNAKSKPVHIQKLENTMDKTNHRIQNPSLQNPAEDWNALERVEGDAKSSKQKVVSWQHCPQLAGIGCVG